MAKHTITLYVDCNLSEEDEEALMAEASMRVRDMWPESWTMTIRDAISILLGSADFGERLTPALAGWHGLTLGGVYAPMPDKQPPEAG